MEEFYPGIVVRDGRIVKWGKREGIQLERDLARRARSMNFPVEHIHGYFIYSFQLKALGIWPEDGSPVIIALTAEGKWEAYCQADLEPQPFR